jgi:PSP1 C-terminal conserved region
MQGEALIACPTGRILSRSETSTPINRDMSHYHLVRVGAMGQVGRFAAVDAVRYPRRSRVVVRTRRGLELGEVLSPPEDSDDGRTFSDGDLLRGVTVQDELLQARLERNRQEAYAACAAMLADSQTSAVLVDVEHLFDGQGLFFYFLGDVTPDLEAYTGRLAETYEAKVQFRKFTETLIEGCGPGCGTEEAKGQGGCDSCSSCAVASACGAKR